MRVGRSCELLRVNLVEVAGEKHEAKKQFNRLALPIDDVSACVPRERCTGIRLDFGESLEMSFALGIGLILENFQALGTFC